MEKEWFVLQTLTGKENSVCDLINARKRQEGMEDLIGRCVVPEEKVTETKNGKKRTFKRKVFPGYVLVEMALYDRAKGFDRETGRRAVVDRTWQFIRLTPYVIGSWLQQRPRPLTPEEAEAILSDKPAQVAGKARPKVNFAVGETVKITDGAFLGQEGTISIVDPDKGKLTVEVQIFSRRTPVDAEYWQVEKVAPGGKTQGDAPAAV